MSQPLLICWNCLGRTPEGTCIHCGKEVSRAASESDPEENQKLHFVVQIRQKSGVVNEFEVEKLEEILSTQFEVTSRDFTQSGPIFVVKKKSEQVDFDDLYARCTDLAEGLTPLIKSPRLNLKYSRLGVDQDHLVVEFKFVPRRTNTETTISRVTFLLTLISIFIAGLLTSYRYQAAKQGRQFDINLQNVLEQFSNQILVNSLLFTGVSISLILFNFLVTKWVNRKFNGPKIKLVPLPTFIPYFEIGTLGNLKVEYSPHRTRSSYFQTSFIPTVVTWVTSVLIFISSLYLSIIDTSVANAFNQQSLIANGTYEPPLLWIIELLVFSNEPITQNQLIHPIGLAALSMIYLFGIQLLPMTQLNGGAMIEVVYGKISLYLTSLVFLGILFISGLWWLLIVNIFLFRFTSDSPVLNELSPFPRFAKLLTIFAIFLGILSLPFPM